MNPREQSLNQQLIGDSFFYLLNKIVPGLTGLISVIVFMRWVGPDGYGQLTLLLSFIMAVGALSSGWLIQAVLRYYTHDISSPEFSEAIRHGILISLLLGFVVLLTASIFFNEIDIFTFIIAYFSLSSIILFRLKATLLRAGLKAKQVTKMTCIQAILGIIIPVLILMGRNHYLSILAGIAIAYLVTGYNKNLLESKKSKN